MSRQHTQENNGFHITNSQVTIIDARSLLMSPPGIAKELIKLSRICASFNGTSGDNQEDDQCKMDCEDVMTQPVCQSRKCCSAHYESSPTTEGHFNPPKRHPRPAHYGMDSFEYYPKAPEVHPRPAHYGIEGVESYYPKAPEVHHRPAHYGMENDEIFYPQSYSRREPLQQRQNVVDDEEADAYYLNNGTVPAAESLPYGFSPFHYGGLVSTNGSEEIPLGRKAAREHMTPASASFPASPSKKRTLLGNPSLN